MNRNTPNGEALKKVSGGTFIPGQGTVHYLECSVCHEIFDSWGGLLPTEKETECFDCELCGAKKSVRWGQHRHCD